MIRDKLAPISCEVIYNHDKHTKPNKPLVEEAILAKLEDQKVHLNTVSVKVLDLSGRASTRLKIASINTIEQLINCSENTLLNIPHVGVTIVEEIKNKLNLYLSEKLNEVDSNLYNRYINSYAKQTNTLQPLNKSLYSLPKIINKLFNRISQRRK